jgi:hypothetical protein
MLADFAQVGFDCQGAVVSNNEKHFDARAQGKKICVALSKILDQRIDEGD